jgi:hypothetical protein
MALANAEQCPDVVTLWWAVVNRTARSPRSFVTWRAIGKCEP